MGVGTDPQRILLHLNDSLANAGGAVLGTPSGTPTYAAGKFGNALSLGQINWNAVVSPLMLGTTYTVDFWVQPNVTTVASPTVFSMGTNGRKFLCLIDQATGNLVAQSASGTTIVQCSALASIVTLGTWYHVALVREVTTLKLYINGTLAQSQAIGSSPPTDDNLVIVGMFTNPGDLRLDEIHYVDQALWTSNFTPPTTPYLP